MIGEIQCCGCKGMMPELKAYALIHRPNNNPSEIQEYLGHKNCLGTVQKRLEQKEDVLTTSKQVLVHPAVTNPYDPLYIGYMGGIK